MAGTARQRVTRLLERQVLDCGHRSSGTPGSEQLIRLLTTYLEGCGLRTTIEAYPIETIRGHRSSLEVGGRSFRALPYYGCPPFLNYPQRHDVWAPIACMTPGTDTALRGAIALCDAPEEDWPTVFARCQEAGSLGVVLITGVESDDRLLAPVSPVVRPGLDMAMQGLCMPVVGVSRAAGRALRERAARRDTARVDVLVETSRARAQNLRASRGRPATARLWVVCHHDSAYESPDIPGAHDNASGVAALAESLRLLTRQNGLGDDVEIVFYDAEEYSLYGSLSLLIDLPGLLASSPSHSLYQMLHGSIDPRWHRPLPEMLIELDAVGVGRELHYGATDPELTARFLEQHRLGGEFDRITITRSHGSVAWMARALGIGRDTDFHFLTLDNTGLVHTPLDDLSRISVEDVCRVSRFLCDLLHASPPGA